MPDFNCVMGDFISSRRGHGSGWSKFTSGGDSNSAVEFVSKSQLCSTSPISVNVMPSLGFDLLNVLV